MYFSSCTWFWSDVMRLLCSMPYSSCLVWSVKKRIKWFTSLLNTFLSSPTSLSNFQGENSLMSGIFALVIHHTFSLYFSCCEPLGILSPTPWNTVLCSQAREFCVSSQYLIKFGLIYLTSVKYSSEIFIFYWDLSYSLSEMKISSSVLSLLKYVYIFKV